MNFGLRIDDVKYGNYSGLKEGCLSPEMSSPISGSSPLKVASSEGSSSRPCFFSVGEVRAHDAEGLNSPRSAETARDLELDFGHAHLLFGLIVGEVQHLARPILKTPHEVDGIGLGGASGPAVGRPGELPSALKHGLVARAQVLDLRAGKPLRMESGGFEGFTEQPDHCFRPILLTELSLKGQFAQQVRVAEGVGAFEFC